MSNGSESEAGVDAVSSLVQRAEAARAVRPLHGVRRVENRLRIAGRP